MPKKKSKVTTRDIAAMLGISQTTVSMILSGRKDIHFKESTVQKVQECADKMGYRYRPRINKEKDLKKTILIMCPSLATEYYTTLIQAITISANNKGLYTMTADTSRKREMEEIYLNMAEEADFYGIIYTYAPKSIDRIQQMTKNRAMVLISDYNPHLRIPLIELDSKKSGSLIANHLLSLGHRHIAYLTTPLNPSELPRRRRVDGMREVWKDAGLDPEDVKIIALTEEEWDYYLLGNRYYDAGYQLTMRFFAENPISLVTAFVGTNDLVSIGIMDALTKMGYQIPKDYSVCGFDNTLSASFAGISLTSIEHSIMEKGKAAADMVLREHTSLNSDHDAGPSPVMRLEYEPQLLVRNSTGPARVL